MKSIIYIIGFVVFLLNSSGCDYIYAPNHYYVSIYNSENDKYITAVYYRDYYYGGERWSKNIIGDFIYPYEYINIILDEGTYDFRAIMEDDNYSYTINIYSVYVYSNITVDICYDCFDKNTKVEVIKTPKSEMK